MECSFSANPVVFDGIHWYGSRRANRLVKSDSSGDSDNDDDEYEEEEELGVGDGDGDGLGRIGASWEEVSGGVRARLVLRNVTRGDAGRIYCAVGNGIGEPSRRATYLLVTGGPRGSLFFSFMFATYLHLGVLGFSLVLNCVFMIDSNLGNVIFV